MRNRQLRTPSVMLRRPRSVSGRLARPDDPAVRFDYVHLAYRAHLASGRLPSHVPPDRCPFEDIPRSSPSYSIRCRLIDPAKLHPHATRFHGDTQILRGQLVVMFAGLVKELGLSDVPPTPRKTTHVLSDILPVVIAGPEYDSRPQASWVGDEAESHGLVSR